jgi:upstream activation factor subunit UAF30
MPTKTPRAKAASATTGAKKTNPALLKPLQPSKELAAVVGPDPLPRGQAVRKVWDYIKKQNLQNPENRREILADNEQVLSTALEIGLRGPSVRRRGAS